jgi:hypothetical protein
LVGEDDGLLVNTGVRPIVELKDGRGLRLILDPRE